MIFGLNNESFIDLDHYDPFIKYLAFDYPIPYGLKMVVTTKQTVLPETPLRPRYTFTQYLYFGMMKNKDVVALQDILKYEGFMSKKVLSTGNFLEITAEALYRWQVAHSVTNIAELDRLKGESCGPKSRAVLNQIYG